MAAPQRLRLAVLVSCFSLFTMALAQQSPPLTAEQKARLQDRDRFDDESRQLEAEGKIAEAIAATRKMLAVEREVFGSDAHADIAASMERLARLLARQEDFTAAKQLARDAFTIRIKVQGDKHWRTLQSRQQLADVERLAQLSPTDRRRLAETQGLQAKASALYNQRKYPDALVPVQQALESRKHLLGDAHPDTASSWNLLGIIQQGLKDNTNAEASLRQAVDAWKKSYGEGHPDYGSGLQNLATFYRDTGAPEKAEPLYRQAVAVFEATVGATNARWQTAVRLLMGLRGQQAARAEEKGDFAAARTARTDIVELSARLNGKDDWRVIDARQALADVDLLAKLSAADRDRLRQTRTLITQAADLRKQGKAAEAVAALRQAAEVRQKFLGADHPDTAYALTNWGYQLRLQKDFTAARPLYEQALAACTKTLGEAHPETAWAHNGLAIVLEALGDLAAAQRHYEQALAIHIKAQGADHLDTAVVLVNLGYLHKNHKDYPAARKAFEQALALRRQTLGLNHESTIQVQKVLDEVILASMTPQQRQERIKERDKLWQEAQQLRSAGKLAEAAAAVAKALALTRDLSGNVTFDAAFLLGTLGELHEQSDNLAEARKAREEELTVRRQLQPADHYQVADVRRALANLDRVEKLGRDARAQLVTAAEQIRQADALTAGGRAKEAEPLVKQALQTRRKLLAENQVQVGQTLFRLGRLRKAQGDATGAQANFEQALTVFRDGLGTNHPAVAVTLNELALLARERNDLTAARGLYEQALGVARKTLGPNHADVAQLERDLSAVIASTLTPQQRAERVKERDRLWGEVGKLRSAGKYDEAVPLLEKMIAIEREVFGPVNNALTFSLGQLADVHQERGDWPAAAKAWQETATVRQRQLGEKHWQTLEAWQMLREAETVARLDPAQRKRVAESEQLLRQASRLSRDKKFKEALPLAQQAYETRKQLLGEKSLRFAYALEWLGSLYTDLKDYAQAEAAYRQAVEVERSLLGEESPDLASALVNLANIYELTKQPAKAVPLLRQAVAIRRQVRGDKADATKYARDFFARVLRTVADDAVSRDDLPAARAAAEELLELESKRPDSYAATVDRAKHLLAHLANLTKLEPAQRKQVAEAGRLMEQARKLQSAGKPAEALPLVRRAWETQQKLLDDLDPDRVASLAVLADLLRATGDMDQALQRYRELLDVRKRLKGDRPNDWDYEGTRSSVVDLLKKQADAALAREDFAAARKLRQLSLEVHREHFGDKDPRTAEARSALAAVDALARLSAPQRKRLAESDKLLEKVRAELENRVFEKYEEDELARYRRLLEPARQALEIRRDLFGADQPGTAQAMDALARVALAAHDYKDAETQFRQALAVRQKLLGEEHPETKRSFEGLCAAFAGSLAIEPAKARLTPAQLQRLKERDNLYEQYQGEKKLEPAIALIEKMLAIEREVRGDSHPETISSMERLAELYVYLGDFRTARAWRQKVLAIKQKEFGADHWQTAEARFQLRHVELMAAMTPEQRRRFWKAFDARDDLRKKLPGSSMTFGGADPINKRAALVIPTALRVAAELQDLLGEDHLYYANCLYGLGELYAASGDPTRAAAMYAKAAQVTGKALGTHNPAYLRRLDALANFYAGQAHGHEEREDWAKARQAWQQHIAVVSQRYGAGHWEVANARLRLVLSEKLSRMTPQQRRHVEALSAIDDRIEYLRQSDPTVPKTPQQKLDTARRLLGEDDPQTADCYSKLGQIASQHGDYAAAEDCYRKALDIRKRALGEQHLAYAESLNALGLHYYAVGDFARAEPLLRQASEVLKKIAPLHPSYLSSLNNRAVLSEALGDFHQAEALLNEALQTAKQRRIELGPEPEPDGTVALNGRYQTLLGEFNLATVLENQNVTLPMKPDVLPEEAASLNNLALVCLTLKERGRAEPMLREALGIVRQTMRDRDDDPAYASVLDNLATMFQSAGQPERAELLFNRVVQIRTAKLGNSNARTLTALNNLGHFYFERGDLAKAQRFWEESYEARKRFLGAEHPNTVVSLANLALLHETRGDLQQAVKLMRQALDAARRNVQLAYGIQSERQQVLRIQALRGYVDHYLSLASRAGVPAAEAYGYVLAWKGAVFAEQRRLRMRRPAAGDADEVARLYRELEDVTRQIGAAVFVGISEEDVFQNREWVQKLLQRKEELERTLAQKSSEFQAELTRERLTPDQLRAVLPPDAALVDFLEYARITPPKDGKGAVQRERRVLAFVLRSGRPGITEVDLGSREEIAERVELWRKTFGIVASENSRDLGAELRKLVWEPLEKHLDGARLVLVSPDGALARLPLAALPGSKPGTCLLEERTISLVPVPQVLPSLLARRETPKVPTMLLLGDVAFDAVGKTDSSTARPPLADGSGIRFAALPGTGKEVDAIAALFHKVHPEAKEEELRGPAATGSAFRKEAPSAAFLHLATHGYFAPPKVRSATTASQSDQGTTDAPLTSAWHPGALSGVVFAGVNQRSSDAVLTALEVSALDLSRTELVVLSACETGLGEVAGGEGVFGLQRAFGLAGAHTVVASLWKVDDRATQELMTHFYDNLWTKRLPPVEALRQAQLALYRGNVDSSEVRGMERIVDPVTKTPGKMHPRLWAAWVLSGDPGALPPLAAPAPTTPPTVPKSAPETTPAPAPTIPATKEEPPAPAANVDAAPPAEHAAAEGSSWPWMAGGAFAVLLALAGGIWQVQRRKQRTL